MLRTARPPARECRAVGRCLLRCMSLVMAQSGHGGLRCEISANDPFETVSKKRYCSYIRFSHGQHDSALA
jgi:hypothetical protein